jgi:hypothetical protein
LTVKSAARATRAGIEKEWEFVITFFDHYLCGFLLFLVRLGLNSGLHEGIFIILAKNSEKGYVIIATGDILVLLIVFRMHCFLKCVSWSSRFPECLVKCLI